VSGRYEFKIIGTSAGGSDDKVFVITVNEVDAAPNLASQSDQVITLGDAITSINNNDGGDDEDADGDTISYTCTWDSVSNDTEDATNACNLNGFSFNGTTGVLSGTPDTAGVYEFQIT